MSEQRTQIIQSQKQLWNILDLQLIINLVELFNSKSLATYIINERKLQGLSDEDISVNSYIYGYGHKAKNPTLHLQIKKNDKDYLHLSIHLVANKLDPRNAGLIHFKKNVYNKKIPKKALYALISVHQPIQKPNSLEFSIADGYTTPGTQNAHLYDPNLQKEMDVIITVLNRLFDEENEDYYIGNQKLVTPIHKNINTVLENMNSRTQYVERKNKDIKQFPLLNNSIPFTINRKTVRKTLKQHRNKSKQTRKYTLKKSHLE